MAIYRYDVPCDIQTQELLMRLQLEDLHAMSQSYADEGKAGVASDVENTMKTYSKELEPFLTSVGDHRMAQSMAAAVRADTLALQEAIAENAQSTADQQLAQEIGNSECETPTSLVSAKPQDEVEEIDDEMLEKLSMIWEGSTAGHEPQQLVQQTRCVACDISLPNYNIARTPCGHEYCRFCLRTLFEQANKDETLFPPRCCRQSITVEHVKYFLPGALVKLHLEKKIELETPNPLYCHNPRCSAFIPPLQIPSNSEVALCTKCLSETCRVCKGASHDAEACPGGQSIQLRQDLTSQFGWQECSSCHRLVELNTGCFHIT
jgi:hypothetical protein